MDKAFELQQEVKKYNEAYQECNTIEMRKASIKIAKLISSMDKDVELYFELQQDR